MFLISFVKFTEHFCAAVKPSKPNVVVTDFELYLDLFKKILIFFRAAKGDQCPAGNLRPVGPRAQNVSCEYGAEKASELQGAD